MVSACKKDDEPGMSPTVLSTDPVSNATNRSISEKITATFSTAMSPASISASSFKLMEGSNNVAGVVTYAGTTATFTPNGPLAPNTLHTATISSAAKNTSGKGLANDYSWSFTTGAVPDTALPTITLSDPANNATNVAVDKAIVTTFSEAIDQATINATTFTVMQGTTAVAGSVTKTATTGTFTPTANLAYGKVYTVGVSNGVKDLAGNAMAPYTFTFTTMAAPDVTLPLVTSTDPLDNATGVARNKVISYVFSEPMDPATINTTTFTVKNGTTPVTGTVAYSGTTATFTPTNTLAANTLYEVTVTTGAKDAAGNALAANSMFNFTTSGASSLLGAVDLGSAANYVILAKTAINNNPTSTITGDMGLSPAATSFITGFALTNATGFATATQVVGNVYAADMADPTPINLTTAVNDMITAYNDAAGRPTPDFSELGSGDIGGRTLTPGLYKWTSSVTMPASVTISGGANDVWIFQISGDLTMASAVNITLTGGAQAKNIFWQVAGQATFGTTSHFEGILLSMTGITFQTGASMNGRALAQTAVILDANAITKPQ
jgi:methionine-rich copper-binding protein CopC